jgi:exosortase
MAPAGLDRPIQTMITEKLETEIAVDMDVAVTEPRAASSAPASAPLSAPVSAPPGAPDAAVVSVAAEKQPFRLPAPGFMVTIALLGVLWATIGAELAHAWNSDKALSHGPLVPLIAAALLWLKRDEMKSWQSAAPVGLLGLIGSAFLFVLAVWADVEFIKALALMGVLLSTAWYLGGSKTAGAAIGPLGFLLFMVPLPTSLTERIAFPLQLLSSTYASLLSGLFGLNVERVGVRINVLDNATPPHSIYSVFVAQGCSGLTSMTVLLALGYLICYFTQVKIGWRMLLMALVVPLTLICNSVRLTAILLVGAHYSKSLAKWVHDNEGPVLIFFCSIALMGIRAALLKWLESREDNEAVATEAATA